MANLYYRRDDDFTEHEFANSIKVSIDNNKQYSRSSWILDMREWCEQNNIEMKWLGESTHTVNNRTWHNFDCYIEDENQRLLFKLRWS
jgi:hypothetical protein